jgi:hypothetical protein
MWRTFLANHVEQIAAADFLIVPTATCPLLFVLGILGHERRRIVHVAGTDHPTARARTDHPMCAMWFERYGRRKQNTRKATSTNDRQKTVYGKKAAPTRGSGRSRWWWECRQ